MIATNAQTSFKYLIIGSGRVARHLSHYFTLLHIDFSTWDRAQDPHLLPVKINQSTHILLALSDEALESFYSRHLAGLDKTIVHFSGARHIEGLISAHPLMTFGPELYELAFYQQIHFMLTGADSLQKALPGLSNPFALLPAEQKAFYHAWCVMGGNFVTLLTSEMGAALSALGVPREAVALYSQRVLQNALQQQQAALTGPLARRDRSTVEANLRALKDDKSQKIYKSFLETYWPDYPRK